MTTIDITGDDGSHRGALPDPTIITDDGDICIYLGEVELRMTYDQFDRLFGMVARWYTGKPVMSAQASEDDSAAVHCCGSVAPAGGGEGEAGNER